MTLVVSVYVPTGIVLSGDSRTTLTLTNQQNQIVQQTNLVMSDSTNKVFQIFNKYGIATFGDAHISNLPIEHYIKDFEVDLKQEDSNITTEEIVKRLLEYFRKFSPVPNLGFIVAGYDSNEPSLYGISVANNSFQRKNYNSETKSLEYGIVRGGDMEIVNRLLSQPQYNPLFDLFNLQDAIDFSRHLIRSTIDQLRFEPRFPTVGGEIDTLVINNEGCAFIAKKQLNS